MTGRTLPPWPGGLARGEWTAITIRSLREMIELEQGRAVTVLLKDLMYFCDVANATRSGGPGALGEGDFDAALMQAAEEYYEELEQAHPASDDGD